MHPRNGRAGFPKRMALCTALVLLLQGGCLDAVLLAGEVADEAARPDVGDPCDGTEPPRCSAAGYKSSCLRGIWTSVECRGPGGCRDGWCDQRRGVVGARCNPTDLGTFGACSLDGTAQLLCSDEGTFIRVGGCPGGCEPDPEGPGVLCR
jgi:hypothetical protein